MKKLVSLMLATILFLFVMTGCGGTSQTETDTKEKETESAAVDEETESAEEAKETEKSTEDEEETTGELPKIAVLLNGNLGDKSFYDSANLGAQMIKEELGCETNVVEMGFDNTVWETTLYEVSEQDYDIIIVGTYQMQELLQKVALEFPENKYIIFDSNVDYSDGDYENVYSISFKQNEASYLAGAAAAMLAADENMEYSNGQGIISAVLAMDIPVLNDFLVGYIQGAVDMEPDTKVAISYIGNFDDTAKAKDLANTQINIGSSVAFNVAAQAGLGMIEACGEKGIYAIGVDSDQALALAASGKQEQADVIPTSVLKNIHEVLLLSVRRHIDGELPYGQEETLGMEAKAVGLAQNEYYEKLLTDEMRAKIDELQTKIESGEIVVNSAFSMSEEEISSLKESVAP